MIELPGVLDAYVANKVVLHVGAPATIDEEAVKLVLAGLDVELTSAVPDDSATF